MTAIRAEPNETAATVRIHCQECGQFIGDVPGPIRFLHTSARAPHEPNGHIAIRCHRRSCRTWNIFEQVSE